MMDKSRNHRERTSVAARSGAELKNQAESRAAQEKARNRDLARKLRKTGQIASLCADVSAVIEEFIGLSDRIDTSLDKGKHALNTIIDTIEDTGFLSETLSESSDFISETVSTLYTSVDQLHGTIEENTRILSDIVDTVNHAALTHKNLKTQVDGFMKAEQSGDKLASGIEHCAELLDVAGLNASLEAGRVSGGGAVFSLIAETIQKTSQMFAPLADDFKKTLADIRAASGTMTGRATEIGDRLRTVSVMSKGVKSAYDELSNELSELSQWGESISLKAFEAVPDQGDVSPGSQVLTEHTESVLSLIDDAAADHRRRDLAFEPALDLSASVSATALRLASEQTSPDVLDDLIASTEEITGLAGELDAEFVTATTRLTGLAKEAEALEQQTELTGDQLDVLATTSSEILETTGSIHEKLESMTVSLKESRTALTNIAGEIGALDDFIRTYDREMLELGMSLERLSRFAYPLTNLISKLEFSALQTGIESARAGGNTPEFSSITVSLETIAGEIRSIIIALFGYADSLRRQLADISASCSDIDFAEAATLTTVLIDDSGEASDSMLSSALDSAGTTVSTMQRYIKDLDRVRDRMQEIVVSAESAASLIAEVCDLAAGQKETLGRLADSGGKLTAQAEVMYPGEG